MTIILLNFLGSNWPFKRDDCILRVTRYSYESICYPRFQVAHMALDGYVILCHPYHSHPQSLFA